MLVSAGNHHGYRQARDNRTRCSIDRGVADSAKGPISAALDGVDADRINIVFIRVALLHGCRYADNEMGKSRLCQEKALYGLYALFLVFSFLYTFSITGIMENAKPGLFS